MFGQQGVKSTSVLNYPSVLNMSRGSQKFIERETLDTRDFNILLGRCKEGNFSIHERLVLYVIRGVDSKSLLPICKSKESHLTMYEIIFVHTQFQSLNTSPYLFIAQVCTRYIPLDIVLLSIPYLAFMLYECHTWLIRDSVLYH